MIHISTQNELECLLKNSNIIYYKLYFRQTQYSYAISQSEWPSAVKEVRVTHKCTPILYFLNQRRMWNL